MWNRMLSSFCTAHHLVLVLWSDHISYIHFQIAIIFVKFSLVMCIKYSTIFASLNSSIVFNALQKQCVSLSRWQLQSPYDLVVKHTIPHSRLQQLRPCSILICPQTTCFLFFGSELCCWFWGWCPNLIPSFQR
jgi:hypothetical protein